MERPLEDEEETMFSLGDLVYLKSGSCAMTVARAERDMVVVVWIAKDLTVQTAPLPVQSLRKKTDDKWDRPFNILLQGAN